jgi:hypothetical protein
MEKSSFPKVVLPGVPIVGTPGVPDYFGNPGYDPLYEEPEEKDFDEIAETYGYVADPSELAPSVENFEQTQITPHEHLTKIIEANQSYGSIYLGVLRLCQNPQSFKDIDGFVDEALANRSSVFSGANFCETLINAGGLVRVTADGTPYEQVEIESVEVERDGLTFIEAAKPPELYYQITEEGKAFVAADNPLERFKVKFNDWKAYHSVFRTILELTSRAQGIGIIELKKIVNSDPVLDYPTKTAQYFLDILQRAECVKYEAGWRITDIGKQALEIIEREENDRVG